MYPLHRKAFLPELVILQDKNVSTKRFKFWKGKGKNEENINQNKENID